MTKIKNRHQNDTDAEKSDNPGAKIERSAVRVPAADHPGDTGGKPHPQTLRQHADIPDKKHDESAGSQGNRSETADEDGIHQSMVAKRMFSERLHNLYKHRQAKVSFIGFQIDKIVWTNQINIIPFFMKFMASLMKLFGTFISIEECGQIMAPLFTENREESMKRSGKFITWKKGAFVEMPHDDYAADPKLQERLWKVSLDLCNDQETIRIAEQLT